MAPTFLRQNSQASASTAAPMGIDNDKFSKMANQLEALTKMAQKYDISADRKLDAAAPQQRLKLGA